MKVLSMQETSKDAGTSHAYALRSFRAISRLEGLRTSDAHKALLDALIDGKVSKEEYIKARLKKAA